VEKVLKMYREEVEKYVKDLPLVPVSLSAPCALAEYLEREIRKQLPSHLRIAFDVFKELTILYGITFAYPALYGLDLEEQLEVYKSLKHIRLDRFGCVLESLNWLIEYLEEEVKE